MINQNARRTGAAGVIARALGTLGAAALLLTSTGWGALAGDTGYGAVNLRAYMSAATGTVNLPQPTSDPTPLPYSNSQVEKVIDDDVKQFLQRESAEQADWIKRNPEWAEWLLKQPVYPLLPSQDPHHATQNPNNYPWTGEGPSGHGSGPPYVPNLPPDDSGMTLGEFFHIMWYGDGGWRPEPEPGYKPPHNYRVDLTEHAPNG